MATGSDLNGIQRALERATERRAALWRALSAGHDPDVAAEVERLGEEIAALWAEARALRTRAQFGSKETIVARARAEERLERDLPRVA